MRDTIDALLSILPADYPALSRKQISSLSFLFPSFTPYSQRPHAPHFHKSPGLVKLGESRIDSMMGSRRVPPKCESVSPNMTTITIPSTPTTPSQNPSRIQTAAQAVASMSLRCDAASQLWDESKVSCDSIPSRTPKKEAIVSPLISSELMIQTSPAAPPQPVGGFRSRSHSIGTIDRDIVRESLNDVPPTLSNPYYGKVDGMHLPSNIVHHSPHGRRSRSHAFTPPSVFRINANPTAIVSKASTNPQLSQAFTDCDGSGRATPPPGEYSESLILPAGDKWSEIESRMDPGDVVVEEESESVSLLSSSTQFDPIVLPVEAQERKSRSKKIYRKKVKGLRRKKKSTKKYAGC
ncbi:hypothetical protein ADUPG1_011021, partial [Aduncisulcus paluster]